MAQLTTSTLIKLIIGLIVVVTVILGITMSFNNYVKPYFGGLFPSEQETNLSESKVTELLKPESLRASIDGKGVIDGSGGKYHTNGKIIEEKRVWYKFDPNVGEIDENGKVTIYDKYKEDEFLSKLEGAYLINNAFRKIK